MVGNSSLFVLFGKDSDDTGHSDFHILDVDFWAWQGSFSLTHTNNISLPHNSTDDDPGSSGGSLSGGAVAGIAIGCVAAVSVKT